MDLPEEHPVDEAEVQTIILQAGVSRNDAVTALKIHGNIVDAVLSVVP